MVVRLLLVEDTAADAEFALRELGRSGLEVESCRVETEEGLIQALATFVPDLVITDYRLPRFDGLQALRLVQDRAPDVPVIVTTGSLNEETAVECLKAGAVDYVLKEHLGRLPSAVRAALEHKHLLAEKRRVEEDLRKLSRAVEQGPAIVMITDTEGSIHYVNPKFTRVTGYSSEDVRGKNPRLLRSGDVPEERYRELWQTITAGCEWRGALRNKRKDGSIYVEEKVVVPIKDDLGNVTHYLSVSEDVTERLAVVESLKSAQEQVLHGQKMEAIGLLAGGVAHDFNNLLSVIVGYSELLLRGMDDTDTRREQVECVLAAADRGAALTRQLLAFSRRQVLRPRHVRLAKIVSDVEKMLRRLIGEDIELRVRSEGDDDLILADPSQIEQVVLNLALNARDAMPNGGLLTVTTERLSTSAATVEGLPPGEYAVLSVSDVGVGMPPEIQARIFEPFFTTKEMGHGTGLGLATVLGIVTQSGGHVTVQSALGAGSTFRVFLPISEGVPAVEESRPQRPSSGGHETILLVEDDEMLREVVEETLVGLGYQVRSAGDALGALELAAAPTLSFDLLFTDVVLPGMNGHELAQRLKSAHPDLRILYASGYTPEIVGRKGVVEGTVPFIEKPFREETLALKVREALDAPPPDFRTGDKA